MTEKNIKARLVNKHDIEAHWNLAERFIPLRGELIIYDAEVDADGNTLTLSEGRTEPYTYSRLKIGDGVHLVGDLPFVNAGGEFDFDAILEAAANRDAVVLAEAQAYTDAALNDKVNSYDDTLTTTDKTIVGAINELNSKLPNTDDDSLLGTWVFNDVITLETISDDFDFTTTDPSYEFAEDGTTYWSTMSCNENGLYYGDWERSDMVYSPTGGEYGENIYWDCYAEYHKTITITSEPTDEAFIAWFRANATKKDDSPYQTKEDENLTTDSKTIVGAINELNSKFGDTPTLVQAVIDALPKYNGEVEDV